MRTICYHLVTAATVFAAGMGQTQVVRQGRLVGIRLMYNGVAGAGGTLGLNASAMLNQNTVNDTLTNNPPRETYLGSVFSWATAGAATNSTPCPYIPLSIEVRPGDLLTINAGNSGTAAPASSFLSCDFYVVES